MTDKTLKCRDCGCDFVFTVGEQEFYKEKGFDNEPTRCIECRRAKKAQNNRR
ncbi:MAG: zinc-ribbon domain-containing protein [Clostridium sp.]